MEQAKRIQNSSTKGKNRERRRAYSADFKLQVVKKFIEESVPVSLIEQECGLSKGMVGRWVRIYRSGGEAGFTPGYRGKGRPLPSPVKQKIVELKESNPLFGIKRISPLLKRAFFLSASPETVRNFFGNFFGDVVSNCDIQRVNSAKARFKPKSIHLTTVRTE